MTESTIYDQLPEKVELFQRYLPVFRTAMGMTASDLAAALDVTPSTILNIENGRVKIQKIYILAFMSVMQIYIDSGGSDIITCIITSLLGDDRRLGELLEKARYKRGRRAGIAEAQKSIVDAYKDYMYKNYILKEK